MLHCFFCPCISVCFRGCLFSSYYSPLTFHFFAVNKMVADRRLKPEHAAAFERVAEQFMAGENPDLELLQSARTAGFVAVEKIALVEGFTFRIPVYQREGYAPLRDEFPGHGLAAEDAFHDDIIRVEPVETDGDLHGHGLAGLDRGGDGSRQTGADIGP